MTVKIVQGLINKADAAQSTKNTSAQRQAAAKGSPAQATQTAQIASNSEAVVTTISNNKSSQSSEKIKSHKEAKAVSESVADRIRAGGSADAHSLDGVSGQVLV